jgi:hypothetical protein
MPAMLMADITKPGDGFTAKAFSMITATMTNYGASSVYNCDFFPNMGIMRLIPIRLSKINRAGI